jgi:large subunit ribosomal protein L24
MSKKATKLKSGDKVIVISGGNKNKRPNKGKLGTILSFVGEDRVIVEGINKVTVHQRQTSPDKPGGKIVKEAPVHVSNVMYYADKLERPVRLVANRLADGTKVRGYRDPESKDFVQIDS